MFKEILKIIPTVEAGDAARMERNLNSRFTRIAKRFGSGLLATLKGGGIVGAVTGILEKLLNPFNDIKEKIETSLDKASALKTFADQFHTSSGGLFKLQTLAQAKGVDQDVLFHAIEKFQTSVAEALADPEKATSVRRFAVRGQDTAEAFFQYIQALGKLPKEKQVLAENEVFGEKFTGKLSEFVNEKNFKGLLNGLGLNVSTGQLSNLINQKAKLGDVKSEADAGLKAQDFVQSLQKINKGQVGGLVQTSADELANARNDLNPERFSKAKGANDIMEALKESLKEVSLGTGDVNTTLERIEATLNKVPAIKALRGVLPFGKGE